MANVYKLPTLAPIPDGAQIIEDKGQRWASFKDESGKARRYPLAGRADGKMVVGSSSHWYGKVHEGGLWQRVKLYTDKQASETRLVELQSLADKRDAGCRTPDMEHAGKPIAEHARDYIEAKRLEKLDADTLRIMEWMLDELIKLAGWAKLADITTDSMRRVLKTLEARGKTASYQNKYIIRAKAFVHWLADEGRLAGDPLANLSRVDETSATKKRARRALDDNEVQALMEATPEERRIKYAFPLLAGLRRSELAALTWGDLKLNAPRPFIQLRADMTKNKKCDVLPLHPYLVELLGKMTAGPAHAAVVDSVPDMKTLARDLANAGIATRTNNASEGVRVEKGRYINIADAKGRRADFHALRHTFCTNLDRTGCSFTTKRALMRHSDSSITEGYSHARLAELCAGIDRLPHPIHPAATVAVEAAEAVVSKTGTDDTPQSAVASTCGFSDHRLTKTDAHARTATHADAQLTTDATMSGMIENPRKTSGNCTVSHVDAPACLPKQATRDIMQKTGPSTQVD